MAIKRNILELFSDDALKGAIDTASNKRREIQDHEQLLQELLEQRQPQQDQLEAGQDVQQEESEQQSDGASTTSEAPSSEEAGQNSEMPQLEEISNVDDDDQFETNWGWLAYLMPHVLIKDEVNVWCILRDVGIFSLQSDSVRVFIENLDELVCPDRIRGVISNGCWTTLIQLWIAEDNHTRDLTFSANKIDMIRTTLRALLQEYSHNPFPADQVDGFGRRNNEEGDDAIHIF